MQALYEPRRCRELCPRSPLRDGNPVPETRRTRRVLRNRRTPQQQQQASNRAVTKIHNILVFSTAINKSLTEELTST